MPPTATYKLVAIGGGRGTSQVLLGAAPYFAQRTAVVAVTDTGRSTGVARQISGIPAPGDLRSTLALTARDPDGLFAQLLQHRFLDTNTPAIEGMAFGNLLLGALAQLTGDFAQAVAVVSKLVESSVEVLPVSTANTQICAELEDGSIREHELAVRETGKPSIRRLFLADTTAPAHQPVLDALLAADVVAIGPGSFFTSLVSTLLFNGVVAALQHTAAQVVYIGNTTTQPGQTDGYTALDHVQRMVDVLGPGALDVALINRGVHADRDVVAQYAAEGLHLLAPSDDELAQIAALGVHPLVDNYTEAVAEQRDLWQKQDTIRHDPARLGAALHALLQ